jgi:hypothetical protein
MILSVESSVSAQAFNKMLEFVWWSADQFPGDKKDFRCHRLDPYMAAVIAAGLTGDLYSLLNRPMNQATDTALQVRDEGNDRLLASVSPQVMLGRLPDVIGGSQEPGLLFRHQHSVCPFHQTILAGPGTLRGG